MRQFDISEPPGELLLSVRAATHMPDYIGSAVIAGVLVVIVVALGIAVHLYIPQAWSIVPIAGAVLAIYVLIAIKDFFKNRALIRQGDLFRFDRARNMLTHNGKPIAALSDISGVQGFRLTSVGYAAGVEYDLNLILAGGEITLPTNDKEEIQELVPRIAAYLGVSTSFAGTDGWK